MFPVSLSSSGLKKVKHRWSSTEAACVFLCLRFAQKWGDVCVVSRHRAHEDHSDPLAQRVYLELSTWSNKKSNC